MNQQKQVGYFFSSAPQSKNPCEVRTEAAVCKTKSKKKSRTILKVPAFVRNSINPCSEVIGCPLAHRYLNASLEDNPDQLSVQYT